MSNKFMDKINNNNNSNEILNAGKENKIEEVITEKTILKSESETQNEEAFSLDSFIHSKEKIKYKNKSFYLEEDVVNQIKKIAKSKHMSESNLVNSIIKNVLNI